MHLFFDFDDTLVETRTRDHAAYVESLPSYVKNPLSFSEYAAERLANKSTADILDLHHNISDIDLIEIIERRHEFLEHPRLLKLDTLFSGVSDVLHECAKRGAVLHIVSARMDLKSLQSQCTALSIDSLVPHKRIVATGSLTKKAAAIKQLYSGRDGIMVGDTTYDIQAGLSAGLKTVAVTTGLTHRDILKDAGAHHVIENMTQLIDTIYT